MKLERLAAIAALIALCAMNFVSAAQTPAPPSALTLDPNMAVRDASGDWLWYPAEGLDIEGRGWTDVESPYDRLPTKAKDAVPPSVWSLSKHSAGMAVRFETNADRIAARWTVVSSSLAMPHMPATGVSGLDLYVRDGGMWRWIGNGRPTGETTEATLASGIPAGTHEYLLYLPLYNGTKKLEIAVPPGTVFAKATARAADRVSPVVVYGTSIAHGGCASRPGMAYPAIVGRRLDRPFVNLGFSGNGKMEIALAELLAEIDASAYVLDCLPNMDPGMVAERVAPFVKLLRERRPETPIVLVENIRYQAGAFLPDKRQAYEAKNEALRKVYDGLLAEGVKGLSYVPCDALLGSDGEATVDGTHATDLGFQRMADAIEPILRAALAGQ